MATKLVFEMWLWGWLYGTNGFGFVSIVNIVFAFDWQQLLLPLSEFVDAKASLVLIASLTQSVPFSPIRALLIYQSFYT